MSSEHYDHEQDERDYYDRENEKNLKNCLFSFKAFAILPGLFFIAMLLFSCYSIQGPIAEPFGVVITAERDLIQVAQKVVNKDRGSLLCSWTHLPGRGQIPRLIQIFISSSIQIMHQIIFHITLAMICIVLGLLSWFAIEERQRTKNEFRTDEKYKPRSKKGGRHE